MGEERWDSTDYIRDSVRRDDDRVSKEWKAPLTQILLEQPGKHRVSIGDEIRLPLL